MIDGIEFNAAMALGPRRPAACIEAWATDTRRNIAMSRLFGPIRKTGYVVPDIRAAMDH